MVPEGGGQGVVSEERVPPSWGEFADALGRMLADALQDVDQVGIGFHAVQPAGDQQTLDDTHPAGADLGGGEQPVSFAHGNRT